jgi:DnaJ-class molecular chaperone
VDSQATFDDKPDLEVVCSTCDGAGFFTEQRREYPCHKCNGAGYLPTEAGKKILDLMRHNFEPMLRLAGKQ